jgi:PAS domain S-box-containing protein
MWNPGAALLFGYTEEEALGSSHRILYSVADTSTGMPERFLREALERDAAIEEERLMCRKDGRAFWASGTLAPLKSASGAHRGFLLLLQDATAARALEERLRQARMDAESARDNAEAARDTAEAARDNAQAARDTMLAASRAKDDFFAVVTHELRTPLTAILLWTRVLRDSRLDDEAAKEAIATIERSARAQQRLIDDLLDLTRVSSGNLRLSMRETHLGAVIQAAAAAIEPAARARGVTLTSDVSASIGMVHADPDRLQQVIWNLLSNSVKFTPTGGSVTLSAWREAGEVVVKVTDTGVGIARDFLPLLFHRFRQAHVGTTPRHAGLGLGLAIARQLTELHGGTLTGESPGAGQGATFLVRLPLEPLQQK